MSEQQPKIRVKGLYKVFGRNPEKTIPELEEGMSKDEVLEKYGNTVGINNASFDVYPGEIFVVMGLSGSGKSTVLRCLNRLIEPTAGTVIIDDTDVTKADHETLLKVRREKTAMVFQHFGLLPHKTVSQNVAFGLELQGVAEKTRKEKAYDIIKIVGLKGYEEMMTGELSGGMQQRVGLARALATDPEILLMDEAFSALDPLIRNNMQDELLDLQEKVQKTIVFITHDLDEALKLGDRIAIMKDGAIVQVGTSEEILTLPADKYVSDFVENVDRGKVITAGSLMFAHPQRVLAPRDGPRSAIRKMRKLGVSSIPVTGKGRRFQGFVKLDDAIRAEKKDVRNIEDILISDVTTVSAETTVVDLLPIAWENDLPIPVVDEEGKLEGIVIQGSIVAELTGGEMTEFGVTENEIYPVSESTLAALERDGIDIKKIEEKMDADEELKDTEAGSASTDETSEPETGEDKS